MEICPNCTCRPRGGRAHQPCHKRIRPRSLAMVANGRLILLGLAWAALDAFAFGEAGDPALDEGSSPERFVQEAPWDRPWMLPGLDRETVDRSTLVAEVLQLLTTGTNATIGLTTALHGAGGFGKTTLAVMVCRHEEVSQRFPGGLLWVTLGEHRRGADIAASINDLCEQLTGRRPSLVDSEQAGHRLGQLLDRRPATLLVIDDVWTSDQLHPFLFGGRTATRLVITRMQGLLPEERNRSSC